MNPNAGAKAAQKAAQPPNALEKMEAVLASARRTMPICRVSGVVTEIAVSHYRVAGLSRFVRLGECVSVEVGDRMQIGEVVRIEDAAITLKPFEARCEAAIGARAYRAESLSLWPSESWKGRVIDALGRPIDDKGDLTPGEKPMPLDAEPPPALKRARVKKPIKTGIRVIDLFTPMCAGQRMGVFAGSGVGKSSMLAMLARAPDFDTVVIALVGERGREVREFLEDTLGDNRGSAIAIVSTGDESPMMRRLAPKTAATVAEYFRDHGQSVLLIIELGDAFRPRRARRRACGGRARGGARLCAERVQRPATASRARGAGHRWDRVDHRHLLRARRRR